MLQEGKAGKRVLVYQDVLVDGKVVATNLLSETVVDGEARIVVKGSMEAKDVVENQVFLLQQLKRLDKRQVVQARRVCRLRVTDKAIWHF